MEDNIRARLLAHRIYAKTGEGRYTHGYRYLTYNWREPSEQTEALPVSAFITTLERMCGFMILGKPRCLFDLCLERSLVWPACDERSLRKLFSNSYHRDTN